MTVVAPRGPRTPASPPASPRLPRATIHAFALVALPILLAVSVALSLMIGSRPLNPGTVLDVLAGGGSPDVRYIVAELRVPRTAAGLIVGAALGTAGALIQGFTRNPLADPGILGVNAGAAFAIAIGIAVFGLRDITSLIWLSFAGALVVTIGVTIIGSSGRGPADPLRLTLAGVALGAVFAGATTGMTLSDPDAFDRMRAWHAGSLLGRGFDVLVPLLPFVAVTVVGALFLARGLNALALGDDVARAQGASVVGIRFGVVAAVTILAGTATAIAGPVSFVGLMVPHVARWMFGIDQRRILLASMILAPILVLLSDVLGRVLIAPAEIPVGVVTAFVGAPVLIALARRRRATAA